MSNSYYIGRVIQIMDFIALLTYGYMISIMGIRNACFSIPWGWNWYYTQEIVICIWIVIAIAKLYLFWHDNLVNTALAILFIVGVGIGKYAGLNDYIYLVMPMVMFMNVPYRKIAKLYATTLGLTWGITLLFAFKSVIPDYYKQIPGRDEPVHHLGYFNHNASMVFWMFFCMMLIMCINYSWKRVVIILFEIVGTIWLYRMTDSLTSTLLVLFFCVVLLIEFVLSTGAEPISKLFRRVTGILLLGTPIYALVATWLGVLYYNRVGRNESTLMSRFMLLEQALESVGVEFKNQTINPTEILQDVHFSWLLGTGNANIGGGDNLYGNLLLRDGLIVLVPYIAIQLYIMYMAYKKDAYTVLVFEAVLAVFGCLESSAIDVIFCVFMFLLFADWGSDRQREVYVETKRIVKLLYNRDWKSIVPKVCIAGLLIGGLVALLTMTLQQMRKIEYMPVSELPTAGIEKMKLHNDPIGFYSDGGDWDGVRLYFEKEDRNLEGNVFVDIVSNDTGELLLHKDIDIKSVQNEDSFGLYYDVISEEKNMFSSTRYLYVSISVDYAMGGKVSTFYTSNDQSQFLVCKSLKQVQTSIIVVLIIYCSLATFILIEIFWSYTIRRTTTYQISARKRKRLITILLICILSLSMGWINKKTLMKNEEWSTILASENVDIRKLYYNSTFVQEFDVSRDDLKSIEIYLDNDLIHLPVFTIALEDEEQNVILMEQNNQLEIVSSSCLEWDVSDTEVEKGMNYGLYFFTGDLEGRPPIAIQKIVCVYGKEGYSIWKCTALVLLITLLIVSFIYIHSILKEYVFRKKRSKSKVYLVVEGVLQFACIFIVMRGDYIIRQGTGGQKITCLLVEVISLTFMIALNMLAHSRREMFSIIIGTKNILIPMLAYRVAVWTDCLDNVSDGYYGFLIVALIELLIYMFTCEKEAIALKRWMKKRRKRLNG